MTWEKLTSRKFLMALGASIVVVGTALQGLVTWNEAIIALVPIVGAYIFGEAWVDAKREQNY